MAAEFDEQTAKARKAQKAASICENYASTGRCFNYETGKKCGHRHEGGIRTEKDWGNWETWRKAKHHRDIRAQRIRSGEQLPEEYEDWMDDPMKGYWR